MQMFVHTCIQQHIHSSRALKMRKTTKNTFSINQPTRLQFKYKSILALRVRELWHTVIPI